MFFVIVKKWKFCCIRFRFVLWIEKLTRFCSFDFLAVSHERKEKKHNSVFSYKLYASSWVLLVDIFFNIWSFIYWTLNKRSLETWSCVCCYCAYGLFCAFARSEIFKKNARKSGVGSRTVWCRSQWVNKYFKI